MRTLGTSHNPVVMRQYISAHLAKQDSSRGQSWSLLVSAPSASLSDTPPAFFMAFICAIHCADSPFNRMRVASSTVTFSHCLSADVTWKSDPFMRPLMCISPIASLPLDLDIDRDSYLATLPTVAPAYKILQCQETSELPTGPNIGKFVSTQLTRCPVRANKGEKKTIYNLETKPLPQNVGQCNFLALSPICYLVVEPKGSTHANYQSFNGDDSDDGVPGHAGSSLLQNSPPCPWGVLCQAKYVTAES